MTKRFFLSFLCLISFHFFSSAQNVEIDNYSVNNLGQVQLSIQAESGKYYVLHAQHSPTFNWATSLTIGVERHHGNFRASGGLCTRKLYYNGT